MGKRFGMDSEATAVLKIKTNINLYRCFTFVSFCLCLIISVMFKMLRGNAIEAFIFILVSAAFLCATIFMDKLIYVFKIPTNSLTVSKNEIIYKKGRNQFVYKTDEISYKFHSFFEDLESLSLLHITAPDKEHYISITKKQYNLIKQILEDGNKPI